MISTKKKTRIIEQRLWVCCNKSIKTSNKIPYNYIYIYKIMCIIHSSEKDKSKTKKIPKTKGKRNERIDKLL